MILYKRGRAGVEGRSRVTGTMYVVGGWPTGDRPCYPADMRPGLAPGNRTAKAKDTTRRARTPTEEEAFHPLAGWSLFDPRTYVDEDGDRLTPVIRDAEADAELRTAIERPLSKPSKRRIALTQQALALLACGESITDTAYALGIAPTTLTGYLARHRRDVKVADLEAQLDQTALPLATENLIHGLLAGDKDYTLETLKGRGAFKRHGESKETGAGVLPALRIEVTMPEGATAISVAAGLTGHVNGTPRLPPKRVAGTIVSEGAPRVDERPSFPVAQIEGAMGSPEAPDGRGEVPRE